MAKKGTDSIVPILVVLALIGVALYFNSGGTLFAVIPGYSVSNNQSSTIPGELVFTSNGNRTIYFDTDQIGVHVLNFSVRQSVAGTQNAMFDVYFNGVKIAANQQAISTTPTKVSYNVNVASVGQQNVVVSFTNDFFVSGTNSLVVSNNLLSNPTFAVDTSGWFGNATRQSFTNTVSHDSGSGSVQFHLYSWANDPINPFASPYTGINTVQIPVTAGDVMSLSGWLKSDGTSTHIVESGISFFDSTGAYVNGAAGSGRVTNANWEQFTVNRTAPVTGTVHVFVTTYPKGAFVGYADDFLLTRTTGTVTASQDRNLYVSGLTLTSPSGTPPQCTLTCQAGYALNLQACACIASCPTVSTEQPNCVNNGSLVTGAHDANNCVIAPYCTGASVNQTTNATTNSGTNNTGNSNTNTGTGGTTNTTTNGGTTTTTTVTSSFNVQDWVGTHQVWAAGIVVGILVIIVLIVKK